MTQCKLHLFSPITTLPELRKPVMLLWYKNQSSQFWLLSMYLKISKSFRKSQEDGEILVRLCCNSVQLLQTLEIGNGERWLIGRTCKCRSDGNKIGKQQEINNYSLPSSVLEAREASKCLIHILTTTKYFPKAKKNHLGIFIVTFKTCHRNSKKLLYYTLNYRKGKKAKVSIAAFQSEWKENHAA